MWLQSEEGTRGVELEVKEQLAGDLLLSVGAHLGGFTGSTEVWVEQAALAGFLQQFEALERTRRGAARLESISPGELVLIVRSVDSLGHVVVELSLQAHHYTRDVRLEHRLGGGFALDPSLLPELLADFQHLPSTAPEQGP